MDKLISKKKKSLERVQEKQTDQKMTFYLTS